jgi:hypothetical protein
MVEVLTMTLQAVLDMAQARLTRELGKARRKADISARYGKHYGGAARR